MSKDKSGKDNSSIFLPFSKDHIVEVPTRIEIRMGDNFNQKVQDIIEADTDKFSDLLEMVGLDKTKDLTFSNFDDVDFRPETDFLNNANFRGASLKQTKYGPETTLHRTLLEGADLTDAIGLTEEKLADAYTDESTIFPSYIDPARVRFLHDEKKMPPPAPKGSDDGTITFTVPATLHRKQ